MLYLDLMLVVCSVDKNNNYIIRTWIFLWKVEMNTNLLITLNFNFCEFLYFLFYTLWFYYLNLSLLSIWHTPQGLYQLHGSEYQESVRVEWLLIAVKNQNQSIHKDSLTTPSPTRSSLAFPYIWFLVSSETSNNSFPPFETI